MPAFERIKGRRSGLYPLNRISKQRSSLSMLEVFGTRGNELTLLLEPISMLNDCESVAGENARLACFLILLCFTDSRFFCFLEAAFESLLEFVPDERVSDVLAAATTLTFSSGCEFDDENLTERTV